MFGDEASLYNLEDVQAQDLGQVGEVVITKDDTLFMKVRIHGNRENTLCSHRNGKVKEFQNYTRKSREFVEKKNGNPVDSNR